MGQPNFFLSSNSLLVDFTMKLIFFYPQSSLGGSVNLPSLEPSKSESCDCSHCARQAKVVEQVC